MDNKAKFLVVDDEPSLRLVTARLLQLAGYETAVAASGSEALAMLQQNRPDLVILDVEMPGMSGIEVCRQIKADPAFEGMLVILVSGRRISAQDETTGLHSGADGYFTRPFEREDFLAHIAAFVRLHQAEAKLRQANQQLEQQVKARTAELQNTVSQLQLQIVRSETAEQNQQESEERYRQLVELSPDAIYIGCNGKFVFVNPAALRLFGATEPGQLLGQDIIDFVHPDYRPIFSQRMLAVQKERKPVSQLEKKYLRLDGSIVEVEVVAAPLHWDHQPAGQVIVRDITERKRAEREAQQLRQELFHVARASTLGELTAALAHELNQPLTAILSNAQAGLLVLNQATASLEELREIMNDIIADDQRAGEIIRHTRALLKKEPLEFQRLDLNALIREVAALLHTEALLNNATINLGLAADLPQVSADRIQVQQVILNLMVNALDAMKSVNQRERRMTVRSHQVDAQTLQVTVEDTGIGIPADKMGRLFNLYYTSKPEGMGMGLSICSSIIKAHGGRIWAGNNTGPGAAFGFTLPLSKEHNRLAATGGQP